MNILVLDDDTIRHEVFARRFKRHDVWHVYDVDQFRRAIFARKYDLIHFDHDLGGAGSGLDAARILIREVPREQWPDDCVVHSWNPDGGRRIAYELTDAGISVRREMFSVKED